MIKKAGKWMEVSDLNPWMLAKLVGGVAVINVGAATEVEMKQRKALVEELFRFLALEVCGKTEIPFGDHIIDLGRPWQRLKFVDTLAARIEADPLKLSLPMLRKVAARFNVQAGEEMSRAKLLDKLFSELIQDHIVDGDAFLLPPSDHPGHLGLEFHGHEHLACRKYMMRNE
jgi:hypothetical protein